MKTRVGSPRKHLNTNSIDRIHKHTTNGGILSKEQDWWARFRKRERVLENKNDNSLKV